MTQQHTQQAITILGSTGSIGGSTLDVIRRHPQRFRVYALTAASSVVKMAEQVAEFRPKFAVMADSNSAQQLRALVADADVEILSGAAALAQVASASEVDQVMAAIVGAAGLLPTLAAARAGKRVLLANKESLVMAGPLFMAAVKDGGATLLPIDSEHNAIFQSLPHHYDGNLNNSGIRHLLLTASGGPFRGFTAAELENVTKAQAVAHPNWSMGQKISVDSATLMNKGLELIEACFLFNCQAADVQIVVHPESVIHSMVQYVDGSVIAQMGQPDMRTPIAYAMAWPERIEAGIESLDFFALKQLNFEPADEQTFACLALARQAFNLGGSMPAVLNAANEIAVEAFLQEQIAFSAIATLVAEVMSHHDVVDITCLDDVLNVDAWARQLATTRIAKRIARKVV